MMIICDTCVGIHIRIYNKEVLVMSASKDTKRGTWKVYIRYKDWQGVGQVHTKRGFATKREALEYEREFLLKKSKDVNMGFPQFVEVYMEDMKPRLKLNTFLTKKHIMETKIIPYFEKKSLAEITATDVIQWQNQLLSMRDENGMPYAQTYLRTIQNQLSAIFNHACRFYGLTANPSKQAGKMGKAKGKEMLFWTKEEYLQFSEVMKDKPVSYYNGEILPFSKKLELIIDPFATDLNQKRVLTKLYSVMEKSVVESEMLNEWRILYSSMLGMVSNVMDNMPYILQCNQEGNVTDLFKQLDVKFETNHENLLEKLIDYICVISEVFGKKVFVLVNVKSYFTKEELKMLYKKMFYEKIHLLLIENYDNNDIIEEERVTIIDKDMCVIIKS